MQYAEDFEFHDILPANHQRLSAAPEFDGIMAEKKLQVSSANLSPEQECRTQARGCLFADVGL